MKEGMNKGTKPTDELCHLCKVTPLMGDSSRIRQAQAPLQRPGKLSILPYACRIYLLGWGGTGLTLGDEGVRQTTVGFQQESPKSPHVKPNMVVLLSHGPSSSGCRRPREAICMWRDGIGGDPQPQSLRKIPFLTLEKLFFSLCFLILEKCHQAPN